MQKERSEFLAWYMYPEPEGRVYTDQELENLIIVKEIFDYCQILLAAISNKGWKKLIQFHGLQELLKMNELSEWFDTSSLIESMDAIKYECLISGYDPESGEFGSYDDQSGIFKSSNGSTKLIVWAVEWTPAA